MSLECVLCKEDFYPIEAALTHQELEYMSTSWLVCETEYVQRQSRAIETVDEENQNYAAFVLHRLTHLLDEVKRRERLVRYQPTRSAVSQDTIKTIKDRLPLERVIGQDRVLRKVGRLLLAHCPWHEDAHPSLTIYQDQHWFCYQCQTGGDVFDWLMSVGNRSSFADALSVAAIMANVELRPLPKSSIADERSLLT